MIPMQPPLQQQLQHNIPPQQQPQQQQNQQQNSNQQQQQQPQPQQPFLPPPPPSGQDWTLSSVLHYLQSEWRRYERDRNEWEIERAESRARIALLEGERRSFENVKVDFMRRIKMLEYALRVERSKSLPQAKGHNSASGVSQKGHKSNSSKDDTGGEPAKPGSVNSSPKSEGLELETRQNEQVAPLTNGVPPLGGVHTSASARPASAAGVLPNAPPSTSGVGLGRPPLGRDPKSRARSREYLKQCLQEVTYLTSPQAVNPLSRQLAGLSIGGSSSAPNLPVSIPNLPTFSVNDYGQQQPQQQHQQQQQQQIFQHQQNQQVQLLPQPQIQPAIQSTVGHIQQIPGTIHLPAASAATIGRPRKLGGVDSSAQLGEVFPHSGFDEEAQEQGPSAYSSGSTLSEVQDHQWQTPPHEEDGSEQVQEHDVFMADPPPASQSRPQQFLPIPPSEEFDYSNSGSGSANSVPGTPASMIKISLDGEDGTGVREPTQLTAIFRPDDAGAWKEKLRAAHDESQRLRAAAEADPEHLLTGGIQPFISKELLDDDGDMESVPTGLEHAAGDESAASAGPVWKAKRTLRSHLDGVRALSFHPHELNLATGGDDNTIKIWRLDQASLVSSASRPSTDIEPQVTLRAHTAPITTLVHSPSRRLLYSASLDATIRVWHLPPSNRPTYAPFDTGTGLPTALLVGHADAVWGIVLVRNESTLVSCSADGKVKVWDVTPPALVSQMNADDDELAAGSGRLLLSWGYCGTDADESSGEVEEHGATSLEAVKTDLRKVAVAYRNAVVKIFDLDSGKETGRLASDISYDGTERTQINTIASHQTIPLLVTAHEDRYIRIFDLTTGQCTHSMLAHLDGVTSLSIDPAGFTLVSAGQDCSVRFWDVLKTHACVQETTAHRKKGGEGVLAVAFHPGGLPFFASAGADGVIKLYASA